MRNLSAGLREFLHWWVSELVGSLPKSTRQFFGRLRPALVLEFDLKDIRITNSNGTKTRAVSDSSWREGTPEGVASMLLKALGPRRVSGQSVKVYLSNYQIMTLSVSLPAASAHNLHEVISLELEKQTPFNARDLMYRFTVRENMENPDSIELKIIAVQKQDMERIRALVEHMRLRPRYVGPLSDPVDEDIERWNFLSTMDKPERTKLARILPVPVCICVLLVTATLVHPLWRSDRLKALAEEEIQHLRSEENKSLNDLSEDQLVLDALLFAERQKQKADALDVLAELTKSLPDDTWLTQLQLTGDRLTIAGYSQSPTQLLRSVEQSDQFSEVRFSAPVSRDPVTNTDRFNMTVRWRVEPQS